MAHFFEKIYPHVPISLQNLGISLYGYAYRRERLGGRFTHYVSEFQEREFWSSGRISEYLNQQLRHILKRAFDQTPYYREKWAAMGITSQVLERFSVADLPGLPLLPKGDLRSQPEQFLARDVPRRKVHRYFSSGTTGTPITSFCTSEDHRRFFAAREARSFNWAGVSILQPRAMIGGRMITPHANARPPYFRYNFAERQVYFTAYHIGPQNVWNYVEGLNRYQPGVLTGYAYSHFLLARLMLDQGVQLAYQPKAIILGSEKTTPEMKTVIEEAFRAPVYEEYGAVEQCFLATQCQSGSLHISSDFGILEVVDERGTPVPPGVEGRIVVTGLLNDTQPLIRYDLGDIGTLSPEPCACGRTLPVLKDLVGRLEDVIVSPDGREMVRFHGIFVGMANVIEAQVIQEKLDLIRVRVVANELFNSRDEALIRTRIGAERLGNVQVIVERVAALERTERGKFRAVISKISTGGALGSDYSCGEGERIIRLDGECKPS